MGEFVINNEFCECLHSYIADSKKFCASVNVRRPEQLVGHPHSIVVGFCKILFTRALVTPWLHRLFIADDTTVFVARSTTDNSDSDIAILWKKISTKKIETCCCVVGVECRR